MRRTPKHYSPFTPGQPVSVEFFVDRSAEDESTWSRRCSVQYVVQDTARFFARLPRRRFNHRFVRDIQKRPTAEEHKVFHDFLTRMEKLGVLHDDPEGSPGAYRFGNLLDYLYFALEAERAKGKRRSWPTISGSSMRICV